MPTKAAYALRSGGATTTTSTQQQDEDALVDLEKLRDKTQKSLAKAQDPWQVARGDFELVDSLRVADESACTARKRNIMEAKAVVLGN